MIKLYKKENCPRCTQVLEYIKEIGVEHEVLDITNNTEMLSFLRGVANGAGFPVVQFPDGQFLAGSVEPIKEKLTQLIQPKQVDFFWGR